VLVSADFAHTAVIANDYCPSGNGLLRLLPDWVPGPVVDVGRRVLAGVPTAEEYPVIDVTSGSGEVAP
jgi:hypothetical protein